MLASTVTMANQVHGRQKHPIFSSLVYIDIGAAATDTATLTFTFDTAASTIRTWDIRASQIVCGAPYAPPSGCLQYHTGLTGRFQTFNYDATVVAHLSNQK